MARFSVWVLASAALVVILIASVEGEDLAREKRLALASDPTNRGKRLALASDPTSRGKRLALASDPTSRGKRLALASDPTSRGKRLAGPPTFEVPMKFPQRGKRLAQPPHEYESEAGRQRRWQMHGF